MPISETGNNTHGFVSSRRSAQQGFESSRRSAQQGFESSRRSAQQGFTLIELMVVITIIGLMSAVVIFNLPDPRGRVIEEAEQFAARVLAVRDEAILTARETRVRVTKGGYSFDARRRGRWEAIRGKPLGITQWKPGTASSEANIIFDPTGQASDAATVKIMREAAAVGVNIALDGSINVGS